MKTRVVLSPQIEFEPEEYQELVAAYELRGTLLAITVCTYRGRHVAYTLRKEVMSALDKRTNYGRWPLSGEDILRLTRSLFQDDLAIMPGILPARVETVFRERIAEVLAAAGVSNHMRLLFASRATEQKPAIAERSCPPAWIGQD